MEAFDDFRQVDDLINLLTRCGDDRHTGTAEFRTVTGQTYEMTWLFGKPTSIVSRSLSGLKCLQDLLTHPNENITYRISNRQNATAEFNLDGTIGDLLSQLAPSPKKDNKSKQSKIIEEPTRLIPVLPPLNEAPAVWPELVRIRLTPEERETIAGLNSRVVRQQLLEAAPVQYSPTPTDGATTSDGSSDGSDLAGEESAEAYDFSGENNAFGGFGQFGQDESDQADSTSTAPAVDIEPASGGFAEWEALVGGNEPADTSGGFDFTSSTEEGAYDFGGAESSDDGVDAEGELAAAFGRVESAFDSFTNFGEPADSSESSTEPMGDETQDDEATFEPAEEPREEGDFAFEASSDNSEFESPDFAESEYVTVDESVETPDDQSLVELPGGLGQLSGSGDYLWRSLSTSFIDVPAMVADLMSQGETCWIAGDTPSGRFELWMIEGKPSVLLVNNSSAYALQNPDLFTRYFREEGITLDVGQLSELAIRILTLLSGLTEVVLWNVSSTLVGLENVARFVDSRQQDAVLRVQSPTETRFFYLQPNTRDGYPEGDLEALYGESAITLIVSAPLTES